MGYAPRCSGRTAEMLQSLGWRVLLTPQSSPMRPYPGAGWALDNGAWHAFTHGVAWEPEGFRRLLIAHGRGADWIILPDIVGGGLASLAVSTSWVAEVSSYSLPLLAVQDGMRPQDVRSIVGPKIGVFVGGSTHWKEQTMRTWGALARERGAYLHIGRVNTVRRIALAQDAGADSFDGASPVLFRKTLPKLDGARRQSTIFEVIRG